MDQMANKVQNGGVEDLAKNMQDTSASPSPTASKVPETSRDPGTIGTDQQDGGIGESKGDDDGEVIQFDHTLFEYGHVFSVADNQPGRQVGFNYSNEAILEAVKWQVLVDGNPETLGEGQFNNTKRDIKSNQMYDVTYQWVKLNFTGETSNYYNDFMYVEIDWKKNELSGRSKTDLFTVTDSQNKSKFNELERQIAEEQKGQGDAETTFPSGSSPTSGSDDPTESGDSGNNLGGGNDNSGGGGGGGLSTGATAGIAVGAVIGGLLLIGALVWFLMRRRRRNKQSGEEYTIQQTYAVDKETHGRTSDSPPYSDEHHMQPIAVGDTGRDRGVAPTPPPGRSSMASHDRGANSGAQTPQGMSSNVAHLVEDGMTAEEIRRLEEEERQLDDEIERAARR